MTALAAAVIPIIRLLVAVATRSGTPIARCISGTLTIPPPTPSSAETTPAPAEPTTPRRQVADVVVRAAEAGEDGRRAATAAGGRGSPARGRSVGGRRRPCDRRRGGRGAEHRDRDVDEQGGEQDREQPLVEQERDGAADERADRREQLEGHPEAQVRDVALEVHAGRGAAGHDHAHQRDADGLAQRQAEAERQQRHDEQRRRPGPSSEPKTPAAAPPASISSPTTTYAAGRTGGRSGRPRITR